jgi:4-amino-4-deoxy-L-arabinose transferase-like glycosyltransferase
MEATEDRTGWLHWVLFALIVASGILFRLANLGAEIRYDEAYSALAYGPLHLPEALSDYSYPNNHVLHTLLLWISTHAFGLSMPALRLPALLFGVGLIFAVYFVATRLLNPQIALLASGLTSASTYLTGYSVNGRGYTMTAVFALLAFYFCIKAMEKGSTKLLVASGVLAGLAIGTVPSMLYFLVPLCAFASVIAIMEKRPARFVIQAPLIMIRASVFVCLAVYLPVLFSSGLHTIVSNKFVKPLPVSQFFQGLPQLLSGVDEAFWLGLGGSLALALLSIVGYFYLAKKKDLLVFFLILPFLTLAEIVIHRVLPFRRVFTYSFPFVYILSSCGAFYIVGLLTRRARSLMPGRILISFLVCCLLYSAGMAQLHQQVARMNEEGEVRLPRIAFAWLKDSMRQNDRFAGYPHTPQAYYYINIYDLKARVGIPTRADALPDRVFSLASNGPESLKRLEVFRKQVINSTKADWTHPAPYAKLDDCTIYLWKRKKPTHV